MKISNQISFIIDEIKSWHLILIGVIITISFALIYLLLTCNSPVNGLVLPVEKSSIIDTKSEISFGDALYFSIVTEATLGYGDIRPIGVSRFFACLQVFLGLLLAGLIVAKITSIQGKKLRIAAHKAEGYWLEPFKKPGQQTMLTFSQIFFDGEELRYDGDNYNIQGNYEGSFKGILIASEGNFLKFEYRNVDQTHLFEIGIIEITFASDVNDNQWISHKAVCHDHGKTEKTHFEGFRASKSEINILKGKNEIDKKKLIKKSIEMFESKQI